MVDVNLGRRAGVAPRRAVAPRWHRPPGRRRQVEPIAPHCPADCGPALNEPAGSRLCPPSSAPPPASGPPPTAPPSSLQLDQQVASAAVSIMDGMAGLPLAAATAAAYLPPLLPTLHHHPAAGGRPPAAQTVQPGWRSLPAWTALSRSWRRCRMPATFCSRVCTFLGASIFPVHSAKHQGGAASGPIGSPHPLPPIVRACPVFCLLLRPGAPARPWPCKLYRIATAAHPVMLRCAADWCPDCVRSTDAVKVTAVTALAALREHSRVGQAAAHSGPSQHAAAGSQQAEWLVRQPQLSCLPTCDWQTGCWEL